MPALSAEALPVAAECHAHTACIVTLWSRRADRRLRISVRIDSEIQLTIFSLIQEMPSLLKSSWVNSRECLPTRTYHLSSITRPRRSVLVTITAGLIRTPQFHYSSDCQNRMNSSASRAMSNDSADSVGGKVSDDQSRSSGSSARPPGRQSSRVSRKPSLALLGPLSSGFDLVQPLNLVVECARGLSIA